MLSNVRGLVFLVALGLLAAGPSPQTSGSKACLSGRAEGVWQAPPVSSGAEGLIDGLLLSVNGSEALYLFQGRLIDVDSPCDACAEGVIDGKLDDGIGPGPDFLVKGRFFGSLYGFGSYSAGVFRPGGGALVGVIHGRYADELDEPGAGEFRGRFRVCR